MIHGSFAQGDEGDALGEHEGHEQVVAPGELAHHDQRGDGDVRQPAVEDSHPHEREGARVDVDDRGSEDVDEHPRDVGDVEQQLRGAAEGTAEERAHDEGGAEVAGAPARSDGEGGGDDLEPAEKHEQRHRGPPLAEPGCSGDRHLREPVTAAEDSQPLAAVPDARAEEEEDGGGHHPEQQPAERRLRPHRPGEPGGELLHRVERVEEDDGAEADDDRHECVERQLRGDEGIASRVREQRRLAEEGDEHRVADDAGEDGRHQGVRLEVVAVEDLDSEERGPERRAEHGGHAGAGAGDEQHPSFALAHAEPLRAQRAERPRRSASWAPSRPAAPAEAEGEDRGHAPSPRRRGDGRARLARGRRG